MPVVVVTDSTASLSPELADKRGIVVVPLQVVIGADVHDEGSEGATPEVVAAALKEFRPVSTSRPTPAALLEVYEECAARGATEIVSVHLSADMSGTFESAQLAARQAPVPVVPVDSRQVGVATGYAALSAQDVVDAGGSAAEAADAARERAARSRSLFYVDTLEYLRRGGGVGGGAPAGGGGAPGNALLGVPPRRADRSGRRAGGRCARGQAAAGDLGGPGRHARARADLGPCAGPARGAGHPVRRDGGRGGHGRPPGIAGPRRAAAGAAGLAARGQPPGARGRPCGGRRGAPGPRPARGAG